jgi:predicted esterase
MAPLTSFHKYLNQLYTTMKHLFAILLVFAVSLSVSAQMTRTEKSDVGVRYIEYKPIHKTPVGVVLFLHGLGERSNTDLTIIDRNDPAKSLKAGLEVPYIVICPQLTPSETLWLPNDVRPAIEVCKKYGLDIHLTGLSLGAMAIPGILTYAPDVFKTAASVAGLVGTSSWQGAPSERDLALPYLLKIPTRFYYGTSDSQIPYGFASMKALSDLLTQKNADNTWITYAGRGHDIWPEAYSDYWIWLPTKTGVATAATPLPVKTYEQGKADMKQALLNALNNLN